MKNWIATSLMTMALASGAAAQQQDAVPKEMAAFQGTWVVTQVNGGSPSDETALVVVGAKYSEVVNGTTDETGTLKIDASKTPMTVDLLIAEGGSAGQTQLGIIEVKGDVMRCLLNLPGSSVRPTSFEKGDGELFMTAQRKK